MQNGQNSFLRDEQYAHLLSELGKRRIDRDEAVELLGSCDIWPVGLLGESVKNHWHESQRKAVDIDDDGAVLDPEDIEELLGELNKI